MCPLPADTSSSILHTSTRFCYWLGKTFSWKIEAASAYFHFVLCPATLHALLYYRRRITEFHWIFNTSFCERAVNNVPYATVLDHCSHCFRTPSPSFFVRDGGVWSTCMSYLGVGSSDNTRQPDPGTTAVRSGNVIEYLSYDRCQLLAKYEFNFEEQRAKPGKLTLSLSLNQTEV